jgi:hypothetical protein
VVGSGCNLGDAWYGNKKSSADGLREICRRGSVNIKAMLQQVDNITHLQSSKCIIFDICCTKRWSLAFIRVVYAGILPKFAECLERSEGRP